MQVELRLDIFFCGYMETSPVLMCMEYLTVNDMGCDQHNFLWSRNDIFTILMWQKYGELKSVEA
jgi:hypothetical protein